MKSQSYWLATIFLLLLGSPAYAQFAMSEVIIDFPDDGPRQHDVELASQGKDVQYITTETYVMEHPGDPDEKRTLVKDPQKSGLMITPNKLVLPAGGRKMVRFLLLKPQTDTDQIYRVAVKPVVQGVEAPKGQRMALKVLVGYEALVIVRPKDAKISISGSRKGNSLIITNKGNTNAYLESGKQCDATGGNCKDLNIARIYAGQSWKTTVPYLDGSVVYHISDGKTSQEMKF